MKYRPDECLCSKFLYKMNGNAVEVKNVSFSYTGRPVLEDITFSIPEKGFIALIGPNGGGKTTLLKLMAGLLTPDQGTISVFGSPPKKAFRRIGYVPQEIHTNKDFPITVGDVVLMGRLKPFNGYGRSRKDVDIVRESLEQMGVAPFHKKRIGELSGGQRQKVFIARALAGKPDILFLDEPTSSVDSQSRRDLYRTLKELNNSVTIVLASHDLMMLSNFVKSVACVNRTLHCHDNTCIESDMADTYQCPMELISAKTLRPGAAD